MATRKSTRQNGKPKEFRESDAEREYSDLQRLVHRR